MPCFSPLKGWKDSSTGGIVFRRSANSHTRMEVGCGQCLGCRLDHSKMWAMRIIHEATLWPSNVFLTLTYREMGDCSDEQFRNGWYVPQNGSLNKKHFQDFMKRLRKHFKGKTIRYYHCGEYGEELDRPHYHACVFNVEFVDQEFLQESEGNFLFTSETLSKLWPYGWHSFGDLTFESAAYTARYILKKVNGARAEDHYLRCDEYGVVSWLEPEYTTMSRGARKGKGGIGGDWYEKFKDDVFPSDEVPIPGVGVVKKVPRFYLEILREEDTATYNKVLSQRESFRRDNWEEYTPSRLMAKYRVKKAQVSKLLIRDRSLA